MARRGVCTGTSTEPEVVWAAVGVVRLGNAGGTMDAVGVMGAARAETSALGCVDRDVGEVEDVLGTVGREAPGSSEEVREGEGEAEEASDSEPMDMAAAIPEAEEGAAETEVEEEAEEEVEAEAEAGAEAGEEIDAEDSILSSSPSACPRAGEMDRP